MKAIVMLWLKYILLPFSLTLVKLEGSLPNKS